MEATIKDVAKKANTSISTVSRVINKKPYISKDMAKRVHKAIRDLNYTPNARGRNLASKKTGVVAFFTRSNTSTPFINPHLYAIMDGVQKALIKKRFAMTYLGYENPKLDNLVDVITSKSIDGIIVHASALTKGMADFLDKSGIPHTVIGVPNFPSNACWVDNNNILSGELAARHLYAIGKEKIAFLGGEYRDYISDVRLLGVQKELRKHARVIPEKWTLKTHSDHKEAEDTVFKLFKESDSHPNGLICANNTIALGALQALKDLSINIPETVAVITFDDYPFASITDPMTTTITIDVHDLGFQAGRLLIEKIQKPDYHFQTYMTVPTLNVRASTIRNRT